MAFFNRCKIIHIKKQKIEALRAQKYGKPDQKRLSLLPSIRGSMALEASFVIPLFLFFMLTVMTGFDILRLQGSLLGGLYQAGNEVSFRGYGINKMIMGYKSADTADIYDVSSLLLVQERKQRVIKLVGRDYLENTCLVSGAAGLDFTKSGIMKKGDLVDLRISYRVRPLFNLPGFPDMKMEAHYYAKAWTGYDAETNGGGIFDDPLVFVAKTGSVYHTNRGCSYLNPEVQVVSAGKIEIERNESGGIYAPCKSCSFVKYQAVYYLTPYGHKYHSSMTCSGISRTVYEIPLSQAENLDCCSKCA